MGNRLRLCLTGVGEKLTDEAEKKLDDSEDNILEPVCDAGRTVEDYVNMGFPQDKIPKELIKRQKDFELGIELGDEDYVEVLSEVIVYEDEITNITQDVETETSLIFLKNLLTIRVLETPFEIDSIINYLRMSWFERNISVPFLTFSAKSYKTE